MKKTFASSDSRRVLVRSWPEPTIEKGNGFGGFQQCDIIQDPVKRTRINGSSVNSKFTSAGAAEPVDDFDWKINASFQLGEWSIPDQGSLRNCPTTPKCLATMITPTIAAAAVANSPAEPNSGIAELPIISILVASLV